MLADSKDATQHGGASATALELYMAARDGKKEVVKRLLQANAPLEHKGNYSWTPLSTACLNGHEEIVKLLLDAGANKEATSNSGGTPLFLAAADGNEAVVKLLLEAGANKDAMDKFGETALVMATNDCVETKMPHDMPSCKRSIYWEALWCISSLETMALARGGEQNTL